MGEQIGLFDAPARRRVEFAKRDRVLDGLEQRRSGLIAEGFRVAVREYHENGSVTADKVRAVMRQDPEWARLMANVDPRWVGAVFRSRGWKRVGDSPDGSHGRRVTVWEWEG